MKNITKLTWLMFLTIFVSFSSFAQSTEDFETEVIGTTAFTDNGHTFSITSTDGYDIETCPSCGWNGSAVDARFVDNSNAPGGVDDNDGTVFSISSATTNFTVEDLYLFVANPSGIGFSQPSAGVTITGNISGGQAFTFTVSSGFSNVSSFTPNNGFTFIDFTNQGGTDYSNITIDELVFSGAGSTEYLALDAFRWNAVAACTQPAIPTLSATTNPICNGGSTTINISGALNDATQWVMYTGFCGITQVGTTAGSSFVVTPTSTTSYYIRGEGGCTTAGTCGAITITVNALDDASFNYSAAAYCADDSDPTPTITGDPGGTFTSSAGLSLNASTGAIDVSASTPGTYAITYTTNGTCPNSSIENVVINALDDPSFSYGAAAYCTADTDPTPTISGLGGGMFSAGAGLSINAGSGAIDLSASTPGTYTITYTTNGPCPNSSSFIVTVNASDDASFNYGGTTTFCVSGPDPIATITGLAGGTFSSTAGLSLNASTGTIDVSASTPGSYTVTYTTTGTCPNSSSLSVTINALDDASFNYSAAAYCADDADPTPTITGVAAGTFSSTAGLSLNASTGAIDVSASTPGTYTVTYTTTGACPNSSSVSVTVNALDDASFSYGATSYCADDSDPTPTVTGLGGGTFSSTAGLSLNASTGAIDVSTSTPGTYTVTYTTTGTCPNSSNQTVTVNALDDATFFYSGFSHCANGSDPTPTITGLPGGTFSSTAGIVLNASTGTVDVSASTPGIYLITYTTNGACPNSSAVNLSVNAADDASFSYSAASYCVNDADPTPTITGFMTGTFSSGVGLSIDGSTGTIDVSASLEGTYTVTYTTAGACPNSSSVTVTITGADDASFSYSSAAYCADASDPTPTITGVAGGTFSSGAGLSINASTGVIDLSASTPGTYIVTYTTGGSCSNSSSVSVTVNALDDASFSYSAAAYCADDTDPTPMITGLAGGTFSSTAGLTLNASTGTIDVSTSTPGTYTVTYTTAGACPNSSSVSVTINALDDASFSYSASTYCIVDSDPTPTITGLAGGTFSSGAGLSINASTGVIDLSASTPGTYTVTYTTAGTCPNSSGVSVTITALDDASFNYSSAAYCVDASDPTPTITGVAGGTFSSGAGLSINASTGTIDVSASTPGTYSVTYTTSGSCSNSSSVSVTINALDDASFNYSAAAYCAADTDPTPTITGLAGGTFSSGAGLSISASTGVIDLSASTPGTYTVTYTTNGVCPNSSSVTVTVNASDDASFSYSAASYCANDTDPTPTITGLAGGTFASGAGLSINASTGEIDLSASTAGTYTVTYTTTGSCPNSSDVSVTINAIPNAPAPVTPTSVCPGDDVILTATGSGTGSINFYDNNMVLAGSVAMPPATAVFNFGPMPNGMYTGFVTEVNGGCESATAPYSFMVGDTTDPTAVCQDITIYLDGAGDASITAADIDGGSTDNCGAVTLSASQTTFDCSNIFGAPANNLVITAAYDAGLPGGIPKGVELYVLADIADLSMYGIGSANNGGGSDGEEFTFPAVPVTAGTYIYVASEATGFTNFFGFAPDYTNSSMGINGDDAVELFFGGAVIDVFGDINTDGSGQPWDFLDGWAYRNSGTGPDGSTFALGSWSFSGINVFDNQTTNATTPTPMPIGTYSFVASAGPTPVTLTVTDGSGNTSTCSANVTVTDTIAPMVMCPGNQTETPDASCNFTLPDYTAMVTTSDNCGTPTVVQSPLAGTVITGTTTITMTSTDASGNSSSCTFDVVLDDATPPTAVCQDITIFLDGSGNASIVATDIDGGSTDNCSGLTFSASPTSFTCSNTGANSVTLTVTDGNGNTNTCTAVVTVMDTLPPTAVCQDVTVYLDGAGNASIVATDVNGGSSDNCGLAGISVTPSAFTCANLGPNTVTLTVTDVNGNTSDCTATVTVEDTIAPTAVCQNVTVFLDGAGNASIVAADIDGGSSDNCGGAVTLSASNTAFTCADVGANNVTLTATDANGNSSTCTAIVTVSDTIAPTAVCQDITVFLDGAGNASIVAADVDGGSTDNCGTVTLSATPTSFTCAELGANNVTLTATDGSGNTNTCVAVVTVMDTLAPVVTCPGDQTETPNASCSFVLPDYTAMASGTDNCGTVTITQSPAAGATIVGTTVITMTGDDGNGNTSTCTFNVILADATAPTAVCQDITIFLDGSGNATIVAADIDGGSTDNCGAVTLSASTTAFTCANLGANNVTLTVSDANSNTDDCVAVVTVMDTLAPVVTCPGDQTETASATCDFILPDYTALGSASDNCAAVVTITQSPAAGTIITANTTITFTSDDGNGNTGTCTFDVILDVSGCAGTECTNAIVVGPHDPCGEQTILSGSTVSGSPTTETFCGTSVGTGGANWYTFTGDGSTWTASTVSAATNYDTKIWIYEGTCGALTCVTGNDDFSGVQSQASFATTIGTEYYVIVGGFSANEGDYELTMTSVEAIAPVPDAATLSDVSEECEVTSLTSPTATDNCSPTVVVTNDATFPINTPGTTVVTWTYTDDAGNTATQTQDVIVTDAVAPVADVATLADVTAECEVTTLTEPTASDNCGGPVTATHDATLPITTQGTTTVTWTYTDEAGNTSTQTQDVVITDVTAPVADVDPLPDVTGDCEVTALTDPTATDNCGGTVTVTNDATLPITTQGTTVVTWTYDDGHGNTSTQTQNVVIDDFSSPVPDIAPLPDVTGECSVDVMPTAPTATDACTGSITGVTTATFPITTPGTTVITWTFDDGNGNIASQSQNIIVNDVTAPVPDAATLADLTGDCSIDAPTAPIATDNCSGAITGTTTTTFPITAIGTTTIVWEFTDANGNVTTQTQDATNSGVDATATLGGDGVTITANTAGATYEWVNCDFNTIIAGETNQSFTPSANGNYAVIVTVGNCSDTSACIAVSSVGIDVLSSDLLSVYPNPSVDGYFTVSYDGTIEAIDVVDMLGRVIELPTDLSTGAVDGSELAQGRYMIRVRTEQSVVTTEIVISH